MFEGLPKVLVGIWIASALASLGFMGLVAWAIITLVNHFTS